MQFIGACGPDIEGLAFALVEKLYLTCKPAGQEEPHLAQLLLFSGDHNRSQG